MHPILFNLFGLPLHMYGLCIALGFLLIVYLMQRDFGKLGIRADDISELSFGVLLWGAVGTRLLHIIMFPQEYSLSDPLGWIAVWRGGLVFQGALFTAIPYAWWGLRKRGIPFWLAADHALPYVPIAQASVPLTDWGFLRSDAAYDVVTVWDGAFFRLDAHLERFARSCRRFRLDPGRSADEITAILEQCVRLAGLRSAYVEMLCTRGQPPWGSRDPRQAVNQFHAFAVPYVWIANEEQRRRGLSVIVSDVQRIPPASVDPTAKNYHWNDMTMGLLGALDAGADTVLLTDAQGSVVEGPGFNVFAVKDGRLVTPREGVLEGITPNDRDRTWYDLTKALMADFDRQMSAEISANFGGYFQ